MARDRRRYARLDMALDVSVEAGSSQWQAQTIDLSPYGVKVAWPTESITLAPDAAVQLRLAPSNQHPPLSLPAHVQRMDPDGLALTFERLGSHDLQHLENLLESLRERLEADPPAARAARTNGPGSGPRPRQAPGALHPREHYRHQYAPLLDHSPAMRAIKDIIEQVADTNATVLLRGESGVGKDLVARAVHSASPRFDKPFVKINCAALPTELLESELFGHEKGAFTGAYRRKLGKFEFADKGTLFLDEIGDLPLALQAKLLHVLQDHEFARVGGREMIRVDTRVVASTNRNLEAALSSGEFREDVYYRLNVVEIRVPPLRERKEEIPILVRYFLQTFQREYRREVTLPADTLGCLTEYSWPGNVRELENVIRRLVVLGNIQQINGEIFSRLTATGAAQSERSAVEESVAPASPGDATMGLREIARRAARAAERQVILKVLEEVRWNRTRAARLLKVSYKTLLAKMAECALAPRRRHTS